MPCAKASTEHLFATPEEQDRPDACYHCSSPWFCRPPPAEAACTPAQNHARLAGAAAPSCPRDCRDAIHSSGHCPSSPPRHPPHTPCFGAARVLAPAGGAAAARGSAAPHRRRSRTRTTPGPGQDPHPAGKHLKARQFTIAVATLSTLTGNALGNYPKAQWKTSRNKRPAMFKSSTAEASASECAGPKIELRVKDFHLSGAAFGSANLGCSRNVELPKIVPKSQVAPPAGSPPQVQQKL